jgi:hypothetical protein
MGKFPEEELKKALARAGNRCECTRTNPDCLKRHDRVRCSVSGLTLGNHETKWHAHHKTSQDKGGKDIASNCEILCIPCHQATRTYGG